MQFSRLIIGIIFAWACVVGSANAATTIYDNRAAFDLATGGSLTFEDFSDTTFENVSLSTNEPGSVFLTGGQLRARPTPAGTTLTYTFDSPTNAFGGDFDLSPGGAGNGLRFVLDGTEIVSEEVGAPFVGFWGFVSDLSFTTLTVEAGSGPGIAETHLFDNLSFGFAAPVAPVPLPAGLLLLATALGGFFGLRRFGQSRRVA